MKKYLFASLTGLFLSLISGCGSQSLPSAALMTRPVAPMMVRTQAAATASPRQAGTLRIATYNIRNLFDGQQNPDKAPEQAKPEKEQLALSQAIHDINADIIGLQEVESKETLTRFRDKYLGDMGYRKVVLVEGNDERGIDVALLSRYPITAVKTHKDVRFPVPGELAPVGFSRDLLQAWIQGPNNLPADSLCGPSQIPPWGRCR